MIYLQYLLVPCLLFHAAQAATVTYNWNIGWINANPDDRAVRPVIAINGKWPAPAVVGNVGDNVIVNVNNNLGNQSLTIHIIAYITNDGWSRPFPINSEQA